MKSEKKITLMISSLTGGGAECMYNYCFNSFANNGWHVDLVVLNLKMKLYLGRVSIKLI